MLSSLIICLFNSCYRQVCLELNDLIVLLEEECLFDSCSEMKAKDWLFLCASHGTPQTCSALDYIVHTVEWSSNMLNSSKIFPSRYKKIKELKPIIRISIPENSLKQMHNIARRLYRIFAHTWHHHKELFSEYEVK